MTARLGYLEIPAADAERLAIFLQEVFNWPSTKHVWTEGTYLSIDCGSRGLGLGVVQSPTAGLRAPTPVVHVAPGSIGAYLDAVTAAGGVIVEERREIDALGAFARFSDSEGNVWGLWEGYASTGQAGV